MNRILPVAFLVFFVYGSARSQTIDATIATYAEKYQQEKVSLHYDKAVYSSGETIWFKAYLLEGINPAVESKDFYVDWSDEKGSVLYRSVCPLIEANANGQFVIPADYKGRFIHVRAYTKWMLNFDTAFLYNKDIRIVSTSNGATPYRTTEPPTLTLFPEGGDAIEGMVNKIAFKATDQWSRPVKIQGSVTDLAGKFIDSLRVQHDGMGFFYLTPAGGNSYTARWKDEKGADHTTAIPAAKPSGVSLQVGIVAEKRFFSVNASPGSGYKTLHVMGTMNQYQVFKVSRDASQGEIKGAIPVQNLPSGILTITVFDEQYHPLAERIMYVNNGDYLFHPEMNVEHWGLNKRARNEISITVPDSLVANLSVSVTDSDIETDSSSNIISDLMLTGDLRGQVYNPAYYFSNSSERVAKDLDLVMLTHGWRRFKWNDVAANKFPVIGYPRDTSYMALSGKVYGITPSQIRESGAIILMVKQKSSAGGVVMLPLDASGNFRDPNTILFDTATIFYQLQKAKGVGGDVSARFFEEKLSAMTANIAARGLYSSLSSDTAGFFRHARFAEETARLLKSYEGQLLGNVTVKSKVKTPTEALEERYTSGLFSGGDGYSFDLINDPLSKSSFNILTYLQGKVAGLQITNPTSPEPTLSWRGGSPGLYLNESPVDVSMISSISANEVAFVKVFRPPFMGGFNGANGAIAIYTKKGGDEKPEPGKGLNNSIVSGYSAVKEFYSPNYGSISPENERADIRTTLYWNPQVITAPGKNKVVLTFYNNDVSKAFRVVIEGMTSEGRLAHVVQEME